MNSLADVLDWHLERYPLLRAEDVYKLVHQSVFGPGHIIEDETQARQALADEFAELGRRCCMQATDALEPLDPENRLVRVNLAPLRETPEALNRLVEVLVATAAETKGTPEQAGARMAEAVGWCRVHLADQQEPLAKLVAESALEDWPPRHHSRVFQTAYRPAYRVVSLERWQRVAPAAGDGTCSPRPADTTD
jgi:hypothetical protein